VKKITIPPSQFWPEIWRSLGGYMRHSTASRLWRWRLNFEVVVTSYRNTLFIYRSITKKFRIKILLEMIDSALKPLGKPNMISKTGYNIKKLTFGWKIWSEVYHVLQLYKILNRSISKKFLIKTISKRTHFSIKNIVHIESVISKSVLFRNIFVMDRFMCSVTLG
jgi:hypothetical protein